MRQTAPVRSKSGAPSDPPNSVNVLLHPHRVFFLYTTNGTCPTTAALRLQHKLDYLDIAISVCESATGLL